MHAVTPAVVRDLRKRRNFVRAIVAVGIAVSVGANVLGAEDGIAAAIAGWPPVALLLSLEVLTRVPTSKRLGSFGRVVATIAVAFASGWLSYWHMAATVSQHGETGGSQYVWPLTVDGLMTISAIAMVEIGARLRAIESAQEQATVTAILASDAASPSLPEAPTSPAIAPAATTARTRKPRDPYGPRNGEEYSPRQKSRQKTGK